MAQTSRKPAMEVGRAAELAPGRKARPTPKRCRCANNIFKHQRISADVFLLKFLFAQPFSRKCLIIRNLKPMGFEPHNRLLQSLCSPTALMSHRLAKNSGVSQQMIGYMERGLRNPTLETLLRIALALEINLSTLV